MASISVQQAARAVSTLTTEGRRVRDVENVLAQLEPDEGPLTTLLSRLQQEEASDVKLEWFEDQLLPDFDVLAADLTAGASTMTVTNYKYFRKGDLVRINDAEIVRVSATPSTTAVAITRGFGAVAGTAALSGSRLFILSDAGQEFDTYRDGLSTIKVNKYNYTQDLATPMQWTDLEMATETFAGKDVPQEHAKGLIEHKKKLEKALLFGQPYEDTSSQYRISSTGGAIYYVSTNVKDFSGGFTEAEFEDWLRICFRYGAREKVVMCSPKAIQSINAFSRGKLRTMSGQSTYGVTMTQYENSGRKVMLVEQKLFTNASLNDLTGVAGYMLLLDMRNVKLKYLRGNGTRLHEELQNPGVKGRVDEYRSSFGYIQKLDQTHGLGTGVAD
jgi:hypothetical protein